MNQAIRALFAIEKPKTGGGIMNSAPLLSSEYDPEEAVSRCRSGIQPVGSTIFKELNHRLRHLFMEEDFVESCRANHGNFKCLWNSRETVKLVKADGEPFGTITLDDKQQKTLKLRLGEDTPWGPRPLVKEIIQVPEDELVLPPDRGKPGAENPFLPAPALFQANAAWVVLVYEKYSKAEKIKRMLSYGRRAFPVCTRPRNIVDPYLHQSRNRDIVRISKTTKTRLEALSIEDAEALDLRDGDQVPKSVVRWWRELQNLVPRTGQVISVLTPRSAGALMRMFYWDQAWDWMNIPDILVADRMITLTFSSEDAKTPVKLNTKRYFWADH